MNDLKEGPLRGAIFRLNVCHSSAFGSVRKRASLVFPSSHFWSCHSVMLDLFVSPKICLFNRIVMTHITLVKKPLWSSFNHCLLNRRFCCKYCNPHTVFNDIAFFCESMVFQCVSFHIPCVHKRFLANNTRSLTAWFIIANSVVQFCVPCQDLL